ncbi:MAG: hypothetical protein M1813_003545 [Trichoglossum hirsutum]|jgi:hypothetical protein|nr:MAG: hypothetical protein M1813_003545 [Trichoglossum hirsutum]
MFQSTTTITLETTFPAFATPASILSILHDHGALIRLNPLVTSHHLVSPSDDVSSASPSDTAATTNPNTVTPLTYEITDAIPLLPGGLWQTETIYKAEFTDLPDGLRTVVHAPLGVEATARWSVGRGEEVDGGGDGDGNRAVWLKEEVEVRCSGFLMPVVKRMLKGSHEALHEKLVELWGSRSGNYNIKTDTDNERTAYTGATQGDKDGSSH